MFKGWRLIQRTKQKEWREGKKGRKAPGFPARPIGSVATPLTDTVKHILVIVVLSFTLKFAHIFI